MNNIKSIIRNKLTEDSSSVWMLENQGDFKYSDGADSEKYLEETLRAASDLSSTSSALVGAIKDWPSEYHLSNHRAQLLSGFRFDRSLTVLEVGGGCGAITRFLGETFDKVVTIEGSLSRARLAKLRTRDLPNIDVVCAPFQKIEFVSQFDIIFCIGVFEYSASFVDGDDPYYEVLGYFRKILKPNGILVLAIENQFGLKYFASSREDHLGTRFEGVEGYHTRPRKVRTFGRGELEDRITRHFETARFFYPYPDYKLPECVLSEEFLASGRAGELVSQMKSRDYHGNLAPLFDESLAAMEANRNGLLPHVANSFLVVAGPPQPEGVAFDQLAVLFSSRRLKHFQTRTLVLGDPSGEMAAIKKTTMGEGFVERGDLMLVETESPWRGPHSLQTEIYRRSKAVRASLEHIFEPAHSWIAMLRAACTQRGGRAFVSGSYVDCTWSNVYVHDGDCSVIDREWVWRDEIAMNVLVIRAVFTFLSRAQASNGLSAELGGSARTLRSLVDAIAVSLKLTLHDDDFNEFVSLEARLQSLVFGIDEVQHRAALTRQLKQAFQCGAPSRGGWRRVKESIRGFGKSLRASVGGQSNG